MKENNRIIAAAIIAVGIVCLGWFVCNCQGTG